MKSIKKLMSLLVVTTCIVCSGCGSIANQSLTPVEASGEQISSTGISADLPKGWVEVEGTVMQDGFYMTKGMSSVTVLKMDVPGLSSQSLDDSQANLEESLKANEASGTKVVTSEQKVLNNGDSAIFFTLEGKITQELIDQNISSGLYSEEATKDAEKMIGKTSHETAVCICSGDTLILIEAITFNDDATGIEEVATFVANSIVLS